MSKLKIGDIVWCVSKTKYTITDYHRKCRVISKETQGISPGSSLRRGDDNVIAVELLEKHPGYRNTKFTVDSKYFELVEINNDSEEEWV